MAKSSLLTVVTVVGLCGVIPLTTGVGLVELDSVTSERYLQGATSDKAVNGTRAGNDSAIGISSDNVTKPQPGNKVASVRKSDNTSEVSALTKENGNPVKNDTAVNLNGTNLTNKPQLGAEDMRKIDSLLKEVSINFPEEARNFNKTLKQFGVNDTKTLLHNLNQSNAVLQSVNRTDVERELSKANDLAKDDLAKAVLKHKFETSLDDINRSLANTSLGAFSDDTTKFIKRKFNFTRGVPRTNATSWIDKNFDPTKWLLKMQVPWKHVSGDNTVNQTEVVQVCKFDNRVATCSAEYSSWDKKLWFQFSEAPARNGLNITVFERGHTPRVTFYNKVNGTDCQTFRNGTFHQICVKVYGYDKDLGPTRVCLELGTALFNHGVASADFGCFRFGLAVRHEEPFEGETPVLRLLNTHILTNNYSNYNNDTGTSGSQGTSANLLPAVLITALMILLTLNK